MKLRIGHLSTFYHTAVLLMARRDLLKDKGICPDWRLFGTGPAIVNSFGKDGLDIAYIGLPPAIIGIEQGLSIKCIAGGHIEGTVVSAKVQYKGYPEMGDLGDILQQFCGLKIGVPGKGSIHDVILNDCLKRYGLSDKIEVINFQWSDMITEAIVRDEIAAAVGTPSLAVAIERYAGGRIIYPPSLLWPNNPSYGIHVNSTFLKRESKMVEQFLLCHEEATLLLRSREEEVAETISDFIRIVDKDFVLEALRISPKYCAQITEGYVDSTMEFVKTMKNLGYIKRVLSSDDIFDTFLIKKIHPDRAHY
ncbi:MAG: ABC transporter substrate-binding protein [Nitrospirota bacterium]